MRQKDAVDSSYALSTILNSPGLPSHSPSRDRLRVVVATGIYPPDIGGPATHARDVVGLLRSCGHDVTVLSLWDNRRVERQPASVRFPRGWPWPIRFVAVAAWLVLNHRRYNVIYATGLQAAALLGARLARRPVVAKVVGDPAWERAVREGLTTTSFDEFAASRGGPWRLRLMRWLRNWWVRGANSVVVPSGYLERAVRRWVGETAIVIPNGVRTPPIPPPAQRAAASTLNAVYVGRLIPHKRLDRLVDAVAATPAWRLDVIGDGPSREEVEAHVGRREVAPRVSLLGALDHAKTLNRLAQADVLLLASEYEGLPHVVVEALACGVPIVSADVGGVTEIVIQGENGLIVDPPSSERFAQVLNQLATHPDDLDHLTHTAEAHASEWLLESRVQQLEEVLRDAVVSSLPRGRSIRTSLLSVTTWVQRR